MTRVTDLRTPLRIAQATWDRLDADDKSEMVLEADAMGFRLIVIASDGSDVPAATVLARWTDPVRRSWT